MGPPLPRLGEAERIVDIKALAKLNLTFEVLGRRDDGYHEIKSIMQTIDLADQLNVEAADSLSVECDNP